MTPFEKSVALLSVASAHPDLSVDVEGALGSDLAVAIDVARRLLQGIVDGAPLGDVAGAAAILRLVSITIDSCEGPAAVATTIDLVVELIEAGEPGQVIDGEVYKTAAEWEAERSMKPTTCVELPRVPS